MNGGFVGIGCGPDELGRGRDIGCSFRRGGNEPPRSPLGSQELEREKLLFSLEEGASAEARLKLDLRTELRPA